MKFNIFFAILMLASHYSFADEQKHTEIMTVEDSKNSDTKLDIVKPNKKPEFPGGINRLMQFLGERIVYPSECVKNGIQGKVIVKFVVFKDGKVGNVDVMRSVHPLLDAEAVRVVSLSPNWIPGELDGEPVNVLHFLPVTFKLQDNSAPALSERDQAEFIQYLELGQQAEATNDTGRAFQYYKECFNINPNDFSLIERIDKLMASDYSYKPAFYEWAANRLLRESEKGYDNSTKLLAKAVELWEKLVEMNPQDIDILNHMEFLYFMASDFDKVKSTATKMYSLISDNDIAYLADAMAMDAISRYITKDYNGVVDLVAPKVDILLTQNGDTAQFVPFYKLLDSYIRLNNTKEAKKLLSRLKSRYPNDFDRLLNNHAKYDTDLQPIVLELLD